MNIIKKIAVYLSALTAITLFATPAFAANTTVVVKAGDLATGSADVLAHPIKWFMYNDSTDTIDNSLGSFVTGPSTPSHGNGSVEFTLGAGPNDRKNIATYQFSGVQLSSISAMSYGAYSHSGVSGPNESPFLNFNVDFNGSDTWQKRLVYVPSANGSVPQDTWNTYDVVNGGSSLWTWSGFAGNGNKWPDNNTTEYRTWNDLITAFPGIRVRVTDSWLGIRVGEPGPTGYIGNVDFFSITKGGNTTLFDFEPSVGPPMHKDDCRNDGWMTYNNPSFKNQGKCVDYVEHHKHTVRGNNAQYQAGGLNRTAEFEMDTASNKGNFVYTDGNKDRYRVRVSSVMVSGNTGWFAGEVVSSKNNAYNGNWLFAKVVDNGASGDTIWGSFTTQTAALNGVTSMSNPSDGPFTLFKGNIKVN